MIMTINIGGDFLKSSLLVLFCYILWGLLSIYWSLFSNIDPLAVLAFRIVWSLVFCFILLLINKQIKDIKKVFHDKRQMRFLFFASIVVTINWGSYIVAISTGRLLDASLAYYMHPIFSIVLGYFVYREKLSKLQWIAFYSALIGVSLPIFAYGQIPYFAIIIGTSFAVYGAIKKQVEVSGILSIFMETLLICPLAFAYLFLKLNPADVSSMQWMLLPTTGIVTSLPLILFAIGIKNTSLSLSGILMYINPTIQLLIAIFFYNEEFTRLHFFMFIFVWLGVFLFLFDSLRSLKKSRNKEKQL